jgi:drug/metabolite transporter (DMT)-like permease
VLTSLSSNQRGILAIIGCMSSYTVNDVLVKEILLEGYPVGETIFLRGVMSAVLIGLFVLAAGHGSQLRAAMSSRLATRSAFDGLSTVCFIGSLAFMPLANLAAVLQIGPLLITALSVIVIQETVGWRRWAAVGVGFLGALLVIKPIPSQFDIWALVAAGSALFAALRELQNRRIDRAVPTLVIAFWGAIGITVCGSPFALVETWRMFALPDLVQLFVASVFVGIAIYLMALAFRDVDMSVVAPFRYSYLLTSALGGFLVFGELPDGWTVVGAALIVGSGVYALHRENRRRKAAITAKAVTAA